MPTYTRPEWVHVEPRRGLPVAALIVLGVEAWSGYELAQWLASIAVIIISIVAVVTVGSLATLGVVLYRHRGRQHLDAPQWVVERCGAPRVPSHAVVAKRPAAAITARPVPAIETPAAVHYHLHLHAAPAAQPTAIREDNQ